MSSRTINLDDSLYEYLLSVSFKDDALLQRLRKETAKSSWARMQISPEQG